MTIDIDNPWGNRTFKEIESSNTQYTLDISELNLYFIYKALEFAKANMLITKPYEKLLKTIGLLMYNTEIVKGNHEINSDADNDIKCDLIQLVHQQGLKVYHCEDSICITKSCDKGRELKDMTGGTQQYAEIYDGYCREWIPTYRDPLTLYYVDGEIKNIKEISIKNGCENNGGA